MYRALPLFQAVQRKVDRINQVTREALSGIRVIRAFVRTDARGGALRRRQPRPDRDLAPGQPAVRADDPDPDGDLQPVDASRSCGSARIRVSSGDMPIGNLIAFLQYVMQILFAVMMAVFMFILVPRAVVSSGRIQEVLRTDPTINDPAVAAPPPPGRGHARLQRRRVPLPGRPGPGPARHLVPGRARPDDGHRRAARAAARARWSTSSRASTT